jgi:ferredoxin--NADP+ reductase
MPNELNARVLQKVEVSPGLAIFRVAPVGWEMNEFEPGQFAVLGLPGSSPRCDLAGEEDKPVATNKIIKRAYSIASSSVAKEYLEFYVVLVESGALTPRLFSLEQGDDLWLGKKFTGKFTLDRVPKDKDVIFVATGTGLAPYMSMLRTHLVQGGTRRFAIFHGARHSWELGYRSELLMMTRLCPNLLYLATISRPGDEPLPWSGETGYVQDLWKKRPLVGEWGRQPTPDDTHVFLCGNPGMVDDMVDLLAKEGFTEHTKKTPGQIHVERYW